MMSDPGKVADASFLSAVAALFSAHALEWIPVLQWAALIVSICCGVLAGLVHGFKLWDRLRGRK